MDHDGISMFLAGRRSSLLQNEAYAQQFDSAAGSHTGAHGPSSVRVYSHSDRDRLYEAWRSTYHIHHHMASAFATQKKPKYSMDPEVAKLGGILGEIRGTIKDQ